MLLLSFWNEVTVSVPSSSNNQLLNQDFSVGSLFWFWHLSLSPWPKGRNTSTAVSPRSPSTCHGFPKSRLCKYTSSFVNKWTHPSLNEPFFSHPDCEWSALKVPYPWRGGDYANLGGKDTALVKFGRRLWFQNIVINQHFLELFAQCSIHHSLPIDSVPVSWFSSGSMATPRQYFFMSFSFTYVYSKQWYLSEFDPGSFSLFISTPPSQLHNCIHFQNCENHVYSNNSQNLFLRCRSLPCFKPNSILWLCTATQKSKAILILTCSK